MRESDAVREAGATTQSTKRSGCILSAGVQESPGQREVLN